MLRRGGNLNTMDWDCVPGKVLNKDVKKARKNHAHLGKERQRMRNQYQEQIQTSRSLKRRSRSYVYQRPISEASEGQWKT